MDTPIAIIDLGTNTFHLLIAERNGSKYRIVYREKQAVKLGLGGINENRITPEAIERAIRTIRAFKETLHARNIETIFAFGTSALRNADNKQEVLDTIKSITGIDVKVISGDREAELIYYGIRSAMDMGQSHSLIIDIGGGSVEFIIGNRENILWKQSVETGGQRLLEFFQKNDPIAPKEIAALDTHFQAVLAEVLVQLKLYKPVTLIGSSGTFDTLSDMYCLRADISKHDDDPETPLTIDAFYSLYQELITKNRKQRMAIPGMIELRVDMIVVACCLIRYILENHSFTTIWVSGYSLKEGVLDDLARNIS